MADKNTTTHAIAGVRIPKGTIVYYERRKGILPKLARFFGSKLRIKRLELWGYGVFPATQEDEFARPIAIDSETIILSNWLDR